MVVLLFLLTVLGCVAVDLALRRRKQAAEEARVVRAPGQFHGQKFTVAKQGMRVQVDHNLHFIFAEIIL